mmetsp:Transcript_67332/g.161429  ORF Transcript_67332/g.161429 Transcript_67332/m.161429 type:complete len:229 (-) Transcript_67332:220-906(-)
MAGGVSEQVLQGVAGNGNAAQVSAEGVVISDEVADFLLQRLEALEQDYARTLAANPVREDDNGNIHASQQADDEDSDGDEAPAPAGYARLGDTPPDSDDDAEADDDVTAEPGEGNGEDSSAHAGADLSAAAATAWAATASQAIDWEQAATVSPSSLPPPEDFADFGLCNPRVPPSTSASEQDAPLTQEQVASIKEVMQGIKLQPPPWACKVSDSKLQTMVEDLLRSEP